jgi:hypothetical protein
MLRLLRCLMVMILQITDILAFQPVAVVRRMKTGINIQGRLNVGHLV